MYTIGRAAELTGVPVATLRAWERRYGVVAPVRTDGGYRLYDDGAIARITAVRDLVAQGWQPKQAADRVLAAGTSLAGPPSAEGARAGSGASDDAGWPALDPIPGAAAVPAGAVPGAADFDALLAAARVLDVVGLAAVLDERFARASFEAVVDDWLLPALHAVGSEWADGRLTTASEHLVAHAVLRRLAAAFEAAAHGTGGPGVLVGLPPGCRHELGALAFATAARRAGLAVTYLGADLPVESWLAAVERARPTVVVVPVPRRRDVPAAAALIDALAAAVPGIRVAVGGGEQDRLGGDVHHLGHHIGHAAQELAALARA